MNSAKIASYIISFLLREEEMVESKLSPLVGYTRDPEAMKHYRIVIYPSSFFDVGSYATQKSYPPLNPPAWRGTPLLFGEPREEQLGQDGPLVIYADIVASTFFLISRYEEMVRRDVRDAYHRFPGKESYPFRAGFIHRPIVEEYGAILREIILQMGLGTALPSKGIEQINLTHDVDQPYEYHGLRSFLRATIRERKPLKEAYRLAFRNVLQDRFWTFPRFLEWNKEVATHYPERCHTILFYKTPGKNAIDRPNYRMHKKPMLQLRELAQRYGVKSGWHIPTSWQMNPQAMADELAQLEDDLGNSVTLSRYHYLLAGEFENSTDLLQAGIKHDYTMGYADVAGFRLGTCRPVRMILPNRGEITSLVLHPLTLMEVTLMRENYMGLSEEQALAYTKGLIDEVAKHNGELSLLFHNESLSREVSPEYLHLYRETLRYLIAIAPSSSEKTSL